MSAPEARDRQLPLGLRYPPDQRLCAFVDAPVGLLEQLRALACGVGEWLYLQGAAGTGKTHLALAVCAEADSAGHRVTYLPLRGARGRLRGALEALDENTLVALDDVHAVAGNDADELALFDFHNRARAAGSSVVYTSTRAPDALGLHLPDLQSRLGQCARVLLTPLHDDGRRRVLRDRAQRRGLVLDEPALDWLLRRVDRNIAELTGVLDTLDRASLVAQRRITVPFLRQTLGPEP